jgi:hypothetical protein
MIRNMVARFTLTTLAALACSSSQPADSSQSDAARTLEQAKARAQELANSTQNYQPVRFVSAIEQVRTPKPVRDPKPEFVVKEGTDSISADPVPMPAPLQDEPPSVSQVDSSSDAPVAPRVPSIIPREAALPAAVGSGAGDWRGNDPGPDMGTTIGVVLRGGRVDPGHCPRHPRPPSQIPNRIPR